MKANSKRMESEGKYPSSRCKSAQKHKKNDPSLQEVQELNFALKPGLPSNSTLLSEKINVYNSDTEQPSK